MNTAYVYKWSHIPTYKWYIGSRTSKKAHPDDGYICSSKIVKPMILLNPNEWRREILATGTPEEMYNFETELLQLFDAKNDERSFNQHNNIYFSYEPWNKGKIGVYSIESLKKMSLGASIRIVTDEQKIKTSNTMKGKHAGESNPFFGKNHSDETLKYYSESRTGEANPMYGVKRYGSDNPNYGKSPKKFECVHCGKNVSLSNLNRWHNDNCKFKENK